MVKKQKKDAGDSVLEILKEKELKQVDGAGLEACAAGKRGEDSLDGLACAAQKRGIDAD
ncbi:MAG: hypothetical protein V1754_01720 [Pseudomonadota bacterium]